MLISSRWHMPWFVPAVFSKALAATVVLALLGIATVIWKAGSINPTDTFGTLLSALIFA